MTFSSLLRFITDSSGMWRPADRSFHFLQPFLCRYVKERLQRRHHLSFFAGKMPKIRLAPEIAFA